MSSRRHVVCTRQIVENTLHRAPCTHAFTQRPGFPSRHYDALSRQDSAARLLIRPKCLPDANPEIPMSWPTFRYSRLALPHPFSHEIIGVKPISAATLVVIDVKSVGSSVDAMRSLMRDARI